MNNHALIAIDRNALTEISTLDDVNAHINETLNRYNVGIEINWKQGLGFSKMFHTACDTAKMTSDKKVRGALFKRVQAIFINEGLNDLIEATMRKFGYQPRFGGSTKVGVVTMKFVPEFKHTGKDADPVAKVANAMVDERAAQARLQAAEAKALALAEREVKLAAALKERYGIVDIDVEVLGDKPEEPKAE